MNTLDGIELPNGLLWTDEFSWTPAQQARDYALDGALIVETATRQTGRPITLAGASDAGWANRGALRALYETTDSPETIRSLLWNGTTMQVLWDLTNTPIEAEPVMRGPEEDSLLYIVTLRFVEV